MRGRRDPEVAGTSKHSLTRVHGFGGWVLEHSTHLLVLAVVGRAVFDGIGPVTPLDLHLLGGAGLTMLGGDSDQAFSDPTVQAGPLLLLVWATVFRVAAIAGVSPQVPFALLVHATMVFFSVLAVRSVPGLRDEESRAWQLAVGAALLLLGPAWLAFSSGHPEEAWIGLLWMCSGCASLAGREYAAAGALGVAVLLKPWGALGLPLIFVGRGQPSARFLLLPALVAFGYVPFFLLGEVNSLDYEWPIRPWSIPSLLGLEGGFTWGLRFLQGLLVGGAGLLIALWKRGEEPLVWLLPAQLICLRLLIDPVNADYYWVPVEILLLVGLAAAGTRVTRGEQATLGVAVYALVLVGPRPLLRLLFGTAAVVLFTIVVRSSRWRNPNPVRQS